MKKIISFILALTFAISLFSISVNAAKPGVETLKAIDIEEDSAVLRGMVTSNSGIRIKEYGFQYQVVNCSPLGLKKFVAGKDFFYPGPINNDVIEYELKNLKDGTEYFFYFYAINENNEKSIGKTMYFETEGDEEDPEITKFKCSEGWTFEEGTEVTFSASADDNNEVVEMVLYIDGRKVQTSKTNSIKYTTDDLKEGEYLVAVEAKDKAKNIGLERKELTVTENLEEKRKAEEEARREAEEEARREAEEEARREAEEEARREAEEEARREAEEEARREAEEEARREAEEEARREAEEARREAEEEARREAEEEARREAEEEARREAEEARREAEEEARREAEEARRKAEEEARREAEEARREAEEEARREAEEEARREAEEETQVENLHRKAYNSASYYGGIKVYVNGRQVNFDVQPELKNGRTMVPLRAIFEALGATVKWNGTTSTVNAYRNNESVELTIGSYNLYTSKGTKKLDQPGYVINGRTLVPVRAISEAFNCDVEWYQDKQLVSVVAKDESYQTITPSETPQDSNNSNSVLGQKIIINGIDIGYSTGEYFSETGVECKCHGRNTCGYASDCTCIGVSNAWQCKGFAMWCQNKLFGGDEKSHSSKFKKVGSVAKGTLTEAKIKELITSAPIGSHIRTNSSPHSMILISKNEYGFTIVQANGGNNNEYSGYDNCRIGTSTYTWNSYVKSTYGQRGIDYIAIPIS